jgi:hypothetical protein
MVLRQARQSGSAAQESTRTERTLAPEGGRSGGMTMDLSILAAWLAWWDGDDDSEQVLDMIDVLTEAQWLLPGRKPCWR